MITTNIILVVICTILLPVSCFFNHKPKLQYWIRLIASILIMLCGNEVLENAYNFSWVNSTLIMIFYLLTVSAIAKAIDKSLNKRASKE